MACSVAGITSDANVLTNELRLFGQRYYYRYREPIPCEQLVSVLCDLKQAYTQYGGKRPFGVSILYMGSHPYPIDKFICFRMVIAPPTRSHCKMLGPIPVPVDDIDGLTFLLLQH